MSKGDFWTSTEPLPTVIFSSFLESTRLGTGGCGVPMTAQDESLGKLPRGATRTRITLSLNAVIRTLARPAVSSTPSFSFSTRCTAPMCCQPWAQTPVAQNAKASKDRAERLAKKSIKIISYLLFPSRPYRTEGTLLYSKCVLVKPPAMLRTMRKPWRLPCGGAPRLGRGNARRHGRKNRANKERAIRGVLVRSPGLSHEL